MRKVYLTLALIGAIACSVSCDDADSHNFEQLCGSEKDLGCLRDYFKKNARCSVINNPNEKLTIEEDLPIYLPNIDLMVVTRKTYLSQFDGDVTEAYMDKDTGNMVITVDFSKKGVLCDAPGTVFAVSRKGMEPKVLPAYVSATYPVILTAVIPASNGLNEDAMKNAIYSAYFPVQQAPIYIGKNFTKSDDPAVEASYQGLIADIPLALKEIFRTKASYIFLAWFENFICDFKLKPVLYDLDLTVLKNYLGKKTVDESQLSKPCAQSNDMMQCTRDYFKEHASCSVVSQADDEPVMRDMLYLDFIPFANSSVALPTSKVEFRKGVIEDLYINPESNNLVLSIKFEEIMVGTHDAVVITHEKGAQPKLTSDYAYGHYPVTLTSVMPLGDGGSLTSESMETAFVSAFFSKAPTFDFGPKIAHPKDPQIKELVENLAKNPLVVGQEIFVIEAPKCFLNYVQKYICNFGLH